jgi:hypothetical protein
MPVFIFHTAHSQQGPFMLEGWRGVLKKMIKERYATLVAEKTAELRAAAAAKDAPLQTRKG